MGMIDNSTKLAVNQLVTALGDTAGTNVYDAGSAASSDIGFSADLYFTCVATAAAASLGLATVTAVLSHSDDNITFVDALAGSAIPVASITAGAILMQLELPPGLKRYTRVTWRVGTAALTAGAFTAFYSESIQRNIARPSGFSVA